MADNKDKKVLNVPDKREQNDACICSAEREEQITKAQPKGNVPALRFPEFTDEWRNITIKEVCSEFQSGKNIKAEKITSQGLYPVYGGNGLRGFTESYNHDGDYVLIGRQGALCGNIRKITGRTYVTEHAIAVCASEENETTFLQYLFQKMRLGQYSDQSAQPGLAVNKLLRLNIKVPSKIEQTKIAKVLSLVDERIITQNKIIEDLKKLKSAIVETLFCAPKESMPAKRLSPYSKEWKLIKLSDICQRVQTKNTGSKCRQVLTVTAQYGLVNQEDFFNKTVASENLEGYYLLRKGDFAYNKSYSGDYAWGAVKRLDRYEQGVLSPLYICFRPDTAKVDADYLAHYFESKKWHKGIADIAGEGARNHGLLNISVIDFFNTIHRIPDFDEQKDIAQVLNLLSFKLSCEQHVMQSLTMQRSYLLQKMFI